MQIFIEAFYADHMPKLGTSHNFGLYNSKNYKLTAAYRACKSGTNLTKGIAYFKVLRCLNQDCSAIEFLLNPKFIDLKEYLEETAPVTLIELTKGDN